ncbi:MAG TPA: hypothetical protein VFI24_13775 [Pyrinomonadaceae bacterium]|nr:hypothetical protein [Pyrinomonadaceae bacterium]
MLADALLEAQLMDSGYITAFAALGGAALGGLTSFATSWTTLRVQMNAERNSSSKSRRQKLYQAFIDKAAKNYAEALLHDNVETAGLIDLHALVGRMRIFSSPNVIDNAVKVVRVITDTYSQPNRTEKEIEVMILDGSVDILRGFSEACREEFENNFLI